MSDLARRRPARRAVLIGVLVLVVVLAGALVGVRIVEDARRSDLARAVALTPDDAVRFSWTDWSAVRAAVDAQPSADPTPTEIGHLLRRAFGADLDSTSALLESAVTAQAQLGVSPASVDWELFSQGEQGALITLGLPDGADFDALADDLRAAGFTEPAEADGVWDGGPDVLARLGGTLTPELAYVALDEDAGLVRTSDASPYLENSLGLDPADRGQGLQDVVDAVGAPVSASLYDGPLACESLAMAGADRAAQAEADDLVTQAGEVNPLTGFAIAAQPDGGVDVAMAFESDEQAVRNADSRAVLASGPAPGQGGDFADRFTLDRTTAEGRVVTLEVTPVDGAYVVSDLGTGPVLFATC